MGSTGWSNGIFDFNNDGRKDLFAANGDLNERDKQSNLVIVQRPDGSFDASPVGRPAFHRGAAFGDFDNDGRIDVVVTRIGERPLLLRNTSAPQNHWLGLKFEGRATGAVVHVKTASGEQWDQVTTAVGYGSASDGRVHFGLGGAAKAVVEIRWPDGAVRKLTETQVDRWVTVRER